MLEKIFLSLRDDKASYLNARKGSEFEERIVHYLQMTMGLSRILPKDIRPKDWKAIKRHIRTKLGDTFLAIPARSYQRTFIYQPYGSQAFPDLLVFADRKVVPLEIKFSAKRQSTPVWNSNVPRANAFYIFGSYGMKDVTFFCGDDVLAPKHRAALYGFFHDIKERQVEIRSVMPELDTTNRGFTPYIRAAFDQRKHKPEVETSFFAHKDRKKSRGFSDSGNTDIVS
jgi:hypothetical protein